MSICSIKYMQTIYNYCIQILEFSTLYSIKSKKFMLFMLFIVLSILQIKIVTTTKNLKYQNFRGIVLIIETDNTHLKMYRFVIIIFTKVIKNSYKSNNCLITFNNIFDTSVKYLTSVIGIQFRRPFITKIFGLCNIIY